VDVSILSPRSEANRIHAHLLMREGGLLLKEAKISLRQGSLLPLLPDDAMHVPFSAFRGNSCVRSPFSVESSGERTPNQPKPHFLKLHHRERFIIFVLHINKHSNSSTQPSNKSKSLNMVKAGMSCISIMPVKPLIPVPWQL
jgi:hypothetical protein